MIRFWKEVIDIMAMVYATLILKGKKHVSDVPAVLRNQVVDILNEQKQLGATVNKQSNNIDATMMATTEIYEETL